MDVGTTALRIVISLFLGGIVGWEREKYEKPAGLRTLTLVCVGSTLFMILAVQMAALPNAALNWDPIRIVAGIIQGIGFLGAGTVIRTGDQVIGLTTAAALWAITAVGIAVALGFYATALLGTLAIIVVLRVIGLWLYRVQPH